LSRHSDDKQAHFDVLLFESRNSTMRKRTTLYFLALLSAVSPTVDAHTLGMAGSHSLISGLSHPILGLDHLLVLLTIGMIVAKFTTSKHYTVLLAASVVSVMMFGFVLGANWGAFYAMETALMGSIFLAAFALWQSTRLNWASKWLFSLSSLTLLAHGWAHGAELGSAALVMFAVGMAFSSVLITLMGWLIAQRLSAVTLASSVASSGLLLAVMG
jgi:urease accessory protein